jgi:hypothetical protein
VALVIQSGLTHAEAQDVVQQTVPAGVKKIVGLADVDHSTADRGSM